MATARSTPKSPHLQAIPAPASRPFDVRADQGLLRDIIETQQEIAVAQLDVEHVMRLVCERSMQLTRATGAAVEMVEGDLMTYRAGAGVAERFVGTRLSVHSSLTGLAARTSQILRCDDSELDPRVDRLASRRIGIRSFVVVPLRFHDRNVGVLKVMSTEPAAFGDEELHTLELMAGLLSAALGHAEDFEQRQKAQAESASLAEQLEERVAERTAELEALSHQLADVIATQRDITMALPSLDAVLRLVLDRAMRLTGARGAAIEVPEGDEMVYHRASGVAEPSLGLRIPRRSSLAGLALERRMVLRSDDTHADPRVSRDVIDEIGIRSMIVAPLLHDSEPVGVLKVLSPEPGSFNDRDVRTLELLAGLIASAMRHAYLYERLGEAVHSRDEFLSIASHELKTPLTSIKLQTEIGLRRIARGDEVFLERSSVEHLLDNYQRQITRLSQLVDDMLDLSRITSGRLQLRHDRIEIAAIVQAVVDRFGPQLAQAQSSVDVQVESGLVGHWDRRRLEQVLAVLMTNALKYAPGSPIEITARRQGPRALLVVEDKGMGIARENHDRIFNRFERAISADEVSGLGLGLFIAREIVRAHGGQIRVESEPGQGARFIIELPFSQEAREAAELAKPGSNR